VLCFTTLATEATIFVHMIKLIHPFILCFSLVFWSISVFTQVPEYYQTIDFSVDGHELMEQLSELVTHTHETELSYNPGVWDAIKLTDLDPENSERVLLVYGYDDGDGDHITDRSRGVDENCSTSDCTGYWNREHVVARSQAVPSLPLSGAGTDVHNLRACDAVMNEIRGNRRFAEGEGHARVTTEGDFYPGDEWAGDVARMLMYMYIRYEDRCLPEYVAVGTSFYDDEEKMIDLLLEWNALDPVSEIELQRNDILEDLQGNRNPFIDNPYLATMIWNGPEAEDRWMISSVDDTESLPLQIFPTLTRDRVYFYNAENTRWNYSIYTPLGQMIKSGSTDGSIDLSNKSNSWYLIRLFTNEGKSSVHRVLKQ